jgi:hypothetical protein
MFDNIREYSIIAKYSIINGIVLAQELEYHIMLFDKSSITSKI